MKQSKHLTKEDLQFIIDNSAKLNRKEIAEKIGISIASLALYMTTLRKLGVDVPKMRFSGNRKIIIDFAEEWKSKNSKP